MEHKNRTHTLSRALDILFALSEANGTLTVSEIAEKVSIPESSTYRFLQTLEMNGIVERTGKNQIRLGLRILDLARSLNNQIQRDLLSLALPVMVELTEKTGETSILFVRTDLDAVCVQHVKGSGLIQFTIDNGRRMPLHLGACGKCILAFENEKMIERLVSLLVPEEGRVELLASIRQIREDGYCYTSGEAGLDVFAISAPVLDNCGQIVASLAVAGPYFRCTEMNRSGLIEAVMCASKQLSQLVGGDHEG